MKKEQDTIIKVNSEKTTLEIKTMIEEIEYILGSIEKRPKRYKTRKVKKSRKPPFQEV